MLLERTAWLELGSDQWIPSILGQNTITTLRVHPNEYPDGELRMDLPQYVEKTVVFLVDCYNYRERKFKMSILLDLHAASFAARQHGGDQIIAAISEIPCLRQDRPTLGSRELAARYWISSLLDDSAIDTFITVHPKPGFRDELRKSRLLVPPIEQLTERLKSCLRENAIWPDIVVSPDLGAFQFAQDVGDSLGVPALSLEKERQGPERVRISINHRTDDVRDSCILLVDDMLVSGGTLYAAATSLAQNSESVYAYVTNFRPTRLGCERLSHLYSIGAIAGVFVPDFRMDSLLGDFVNGVPLGDLVFEQIGHAIS